MMLLLQQEGYELLESHDGNGTIIIVDYLVKTGWANVQVSLVGYCDLHEHGHSALDELLTSIFANTAASSKPTDGLVDVVLSSKCVSHSMWLSCHSNERARCAVAHQHVDVSAAAAPPCRRPVHTPVGPSTGCSPCRSPTSTGRTSSVHPVTFYVLMAFR